MFQVVVAGFLSLIYTCFNDFVDGIYLLSEGIKDYDKRCLLIEVGLGTFDLELGRGILEPVIQ
uniref:Uncharacterized protein n=1 Tax=Rhizophora mucronata TaxID=61149 RepID=A0A2P2P313_RHIMU